MEALNLKAASVVNAQYRAVDTAFSMALPLLFLLSGCKTVPPTVPPSVSISFVSDPSGARIDQNQNCRANDADSPTYYVPNPIPIGGIGGYFIPLRGFFAGEFAPHVKPYSADPIVATLDWCYRAVWPELRQRSRVVFVRELYANPNSFVFRPEAPYKSPEPQQLPMKYIMKGPPFVHPDEAEEPVGNASRAGPYPEDNFKRLEDLKSLFDKGVLTKDEYEQKRKEVLQRIK